MAKRSQTKLNRTNNNTYILVWYIYRWYRLGSERECSVCVCARSARTKIVYVSKYGTAAAAAASAYTISHTVRHTHTLCHAMPCCSVCISLHTLRMFAYGSFLRYSRPIFIMPTFVFDSIHFTRTHTNGCCCCFSPSARSKCMGTLKAKKEHEYHSSTNNNNNNSQNEPYQIKLKCVCYIRTYAKRTNERMDERARTHTHSEHIEQAST